MEVTSAAQSESNKRQKTQEAHLIPGLEDRRVWGFPNSIITKMRYIDIISYTATLGATVTNLFRANSIFDPDASGVGHQPLYHDQYQTLYDQYVVLGSKITATFCSRTAGVNFIAGIVGDDDSTVTTTLTTKMEQNNSVSRACGPTTSGVEPNTLTCTFSPFEMFGVDAKDDGSASTQFGTNPSEEWYFGVYVQAMDGASTVVVDVKVEIEYTVKCSELKTPTAS